MILAIVLLGMVGWTVYEFVIATDSADSDKEDTQTQVDSFESEDEPASFESEVREAFDTDEEEENESENEIGLEIGNTAPDFQLTTLDGEEVSLSDYRGKNVMLNFWATWCPPCRAEMPDMEQFYQDTDIEILAVNLTETEATLDQVHQFKDEYELTFSILLDETVEVANLYAIQPVPTSFIIDSEGIIQFKTFGPLTYDQMVYVLEDMVESSA